MKTLELNQMENFLGGLSNEGIKDGINYACVGVAAVSILSGIFTFGASTVLGLTYASSFCLGFAVAQL